MKKILIITIQSENFGNRLQNYGLQKSLQSLGFKVYSALGKPRSIKRKVIDYIRPIIKKDKYTNFTLFNRKIKYSNDILNIDTYKVKKYYAIVAGSDQIWNTTFKKLMGQSFFVWDMTFLYKINISSANP